MILPYILKTIWWTNAIIGILDPCDAKINLIKCMWVSDVHFVVQWFWFISWPHSEGGMLDWSYWFSVTLSLTYKYICRSVTYILWYSDSAIYFQYYWWISLILWILVLKRATDLYFMIKCFPVRSGLEFVPRIGSEKGLIPHIIWRFPVDPGASK